MSDLTIAYFGHDADESTVLKRAAAFLRAGAVVEGFMFRRPRPGLVRLIPFRNVELGHTEDRNYLRRIPRLLVGLTRALRRARRLRRADVIYARNIDMLAVALACRFLARSKAAVVYEVLDIQRPFTHPGAVGQLFRAAERIGLRFSTLLVVSSPDFITRYFGPAQGRTAGWFLLENKMPPGTPRVAAARAPGPPWVIGWFGTLRCRKSFTQLCAIAERLGPHVVIHLAGRPSPTDLSVAEIEAAARRLGNLRYLGGYDGAAEVAALYAPTHFSWCIDYTDADTNSDWLLPNRLYEGGVNGAVALTRAGTATARLAVERGTGLCFADTQTGIGDYLLALTPGAYADAQAQLAALPDDMFVDVADTGKLVDALRGLSPAATTDDARRLNDRRGDMRREEERVGVRDA